LWGIGSAFGEDSIGSVLQYNRVLSNSEILQNYNSLKYRFGYTSPFTQDGLVVYFDVANPSSYPGSGTKIYDISGNGHDGTLVNGVAYSSNNGGILVFDGVDDFIDVPGPNLAGTNYTVIAAGRYVSIPYVGPPYGDGRLISARSNNWLIGLWGGNTENYYAEGWVSSVGAGNSDTNWRFWAATGDISGDSYSAYVNNTITVNSSTAGSQGPNGFSLGRYGPGDSEYSNSNFGFMLVYNRILNTTEMTEIYNYFKGRYGL
jgi:hypothetical protein